MARPTHRSHDARCHADAPLSRCQSFSDPDFEALVKTNRAIGGYPIRSEAEVDAATAQMFAAVLADPKSYVPEERRSACLFEPGYAVAFEKDGRSVSVLICFKCGDVSFQPDPGVQEKPFGTGWGFEASDGVKRMRDAMMKLLPVTPPP